MELTTGGSPNPVTYIAKKRSWTGLIVCVFLIATMQAQTGSVADRATRSGQKITLHPSEVAFTVPAEWLARYDKSHDNLHLTAPQLDSVRVGAGEWDTEYAAVANSVLPFQDCVAHVGGEGWGRNGFVYSDVQLRVYVTPFNEEQVRTSVSREGLGAAHSVNSNASFLPAVEVGSWHRTSLTYDVFYDDYGGTARVDFFTRTYKGQTIVVVAMYCDTNRFGAVETVAAILRSFEFPPE